MPDQIIELPSNPFGEPIDAFKILQDLGVILTEGHFRLSSERHSSVYIEKRKLYRNQPATYLIARAIARRFEKDVVTLVVGPQTGVLYRNPLADFAAQHLEGIPSACAMKGPNKTFFFENEEPELVTGKNVLVVDDTLTTGASLKKVIDLTRAHGGKVIGAGAICIRGEVTRETLGVDKLEALIEMRLPDWSVEECPKCREGIPITELPVR